MKFSATIVMVCAMGAYSQTASVSTTTSVSGAPTIRSSTSSGLSVTLTSSTARVTGQATTTSVSGRPTSTTTSRPSTTSPVKAGAGPNAIPGVGLAAILALGAYVA